VTGSKVQALLQTYFECHYHSAHPNTWEMSEGTSFTVLYQALGGKTLYGRGIKQEVCGGGLWLKGVLGLPCPP